MGITRKKYRKRGGNIKQVATYIPLPDYYYLNLYGMVNNKSTATITSDIITAWHTQNPSRTVLVNELASKLTAKLKVDFLENPVKNEKKFIAEKLQDLRLELRGQLSEADVNALLTKIRNKYEEE